MYDCWLRYDLNSGDYSEFLPYFSSVCCSDKSEIINTALTEFTSAVKRICGLTPVIYTEQPSDSFVRLEISPEISEKDGFIISADSSRITIAGGSGSGVLYGVFRLMQLVTAGKSLSECCIAEAPSYPIRMIDHWDNISGEIERGYAGKSIFFENGTITENMDRIHDYARILASVGINSVSINNVNVHAEESKFITDKYLPRIARIADIFRSFGITLYLSANYASPIELGGLDTADPLDPSVSAWWRTAVENLYKFIPDFGGFVVKADSENRPGPFTYGRNHADGANMLAKVLLPFGGKVIWRCFVYNCHLDWRDRSIDRARAQYDNFKPLDGMFMENVILQVKNGPMDFQIREATSPLFGAMNSTNIMAEFQIAQEYTGQQKHVCFLAEMWRECLDFNVDSSVGRVRDTISGIAAVSNIGDTECWTGHPLAQANLFAYGRLTWNPSLTPEEIAAEWISLTLGSSEKILSAVLPILLTSRRTYENYTTPLGIGWMVTPHYHYGPSVDGYEYSPWGTYHYADCFGMGVDRTAATGTGYTSQYYKENADMYEDLSKCPDDLVLFFHHIPYTYVLKCGKTMLQYFYDSHFDGVEAVAEYISAWAALKGSVEDGIYNLVDNLLHIQYNSSVEWRDVVNTYFYRKSGIDDNKSRKIYK